MCPEPESDAYLECFARGAILAYCLFDSEGRPFGEANTPAGVVTEDPEDATGIGDSGGAARDEPKGGRPGESDAPSPTTAPADDEVDLELVATSYPGSRAGKYINVSALRQMMAHWRGVLADAAWLHREYRQREAREVLGVMDVWWLGKIGIALPAFLHRRRRAPIANGELPARVAAQFKVIQGLYLTADRMLLHGYPTDRPIEPTAFLDFAESSGAFLEGERACAGPLAFIREYLDVVLAGIEPEGADGWLADTIGDRDAFWAYARHTTLAELAYLWFETQSQWFLRETLATLARPPASTDPRASVLRAAIEPHITNRPDILIVTRKDHLLGLLTREHTELAGWTGVVNAASSEAALVPAVGAPLASLLLGYLAFERRVLALFFTFQRAINAALGRGGPAAPPQGRDLSAIFVGLPLADHLAAWAGLTIDRRAERTVITDRTGRVLVDEAARA